MVYGSAISGLFTSVGRLSEGSLNEVFGMSHTVICYKCNRSVTPLERREKDKKAKRTWLITYCPYKRCNANIDIQPAPAVRLWNGTNFFSTEDLPDDTHP